VVGTPLDKVYPAKHAALQHAIYLDHLLLSPSTWGDKFVPSNFPERNRIMARAAMATVIIEASDTSGSLHQAAESVMEHLDRDLAIEPRIVRRARHIVRSPTFRCAPNPASGLQPAPRPQTASPVSPRRKPMDWPIL